jgi:Asp-tRNA(Asn)/Glu-tRNA(Gln) amidotransferase A subunit family amidase
VICRCLLRADLIMTERVSLDSETLVYDPKVPVLRQFVDYVARFHDGGDSPRQYLERCLEKIESLEPKIGAFVHLDIEGARYAADEATARYRAGRSASQIDGMPIGIKDIIATRGLPTEMNSPIFAGFRPRRDAAAVVALRNAGAFVLGKTVTTEFACGRSGPTKNPFDETRTPGGSSSGSAAAVGVGILPAALGTQTQASLIRPASYCGAYAFKPSHRLLRVDGIAPLAQSLDHLGVIGASLRDIWEVTRVIAALGPEPGGPAISIGEFPAPARPRRLIRLETEGWCETDPVSREEFDRALATIAQGGIEILDRYRDPRIAELETQIELTGRAALDIFAHEAQWPLRAYLDCGADLVGERIKELVAIAEKLPRRAYERALSLRASLRNSVAALSGVADGFLSLASSGPAPKGLTHTGSRSYGVPWTMLGAPSIALPVLTAERLPLGLQVMGFSEADSATFAISRWIATTLMD